MLPGLARLHGYGFVVDVAKVRAANLGVQEANPFGGGLFGGFGAPNPLGAPIPFGGLHGAAEPPPPSLLRGPAKAALDRCISGDGEAPLKLTIAAVACAGSGVVCGIPVQHMREADTMTELDLPKRRTYLRLDMPAAMLISYLIPAMGSLTVANLLGNQLDAESAKMLTEVAKQKGISLCGIRRDQTTADFSMQNLKPPDAILLASDLSQAVVTGSLTSIDLSNNELTNYGRDMTGIKQLAAALGVNGSLTSLDLSSNQLCGVTRWGIGTYTADGITAIADALRVNGGLTQVP